MWARARVERASARERVGWRRTREGGGQVVFGALFARVVVVEAHHVEAGAEGGARPGRQAEAVHPPVAAALRRAEVGLKRGGGRGVGQIIVAHVEGGKGGAGADGASPSSVRLSWMAGCMASAPSCAIGHSRRRPGRKTTTE